MYFPLHIDTKSMDLIILYLWGSNLEFAEYWCILSLTICFNLKEQCRPDEMQQLAYCISSGYSLFAKVLVYGVSKIRRFNTAKTNSLKQPNFRSTLSIIIVSQHSLHTMCRSREGTGGPDPIPP